MFDFYDGFRDKAVAALEAGDFRTAFRQLRRVLDYPGMLDLPERWPEALTLFARIAEAIAGPEFATLVRDVAENPDRRDALYELGYQLIEQGLDPIAATVLQRAHVAAPSDAQILTEYVCALERGGFHADACRVLRAQPGLVEESYLCRYLLTFNALMTADLEEPRRLLSGLREMGGEADHILMTRHLEGMMLRADALRGATTLDARDLRGWHLAINGGVLLSLSPHGLQEGMNGRYAFTQDSLENCREGIARVGALLDGLAVRPPRVFFLDDRPSAILAHATAKVMGVPLEPWPAAGSTKPGLIVTYDLSQLERAEIGSLHAHVPGQVLWSHANGWTVEQPFTPDLTTYLYQFNQNPWEERLVVEPGNSAGRTLPPIEGSPEHLGAALAAMPVPEGGLSDLPAVLALARAAQSCTEEHAAGVFRTTGGRRRFRLSSPVPSNRFV